MVLICCQVIVGAINALLSGLERATVERVSLPMGVVFDFVTGAVKSITLKK
jgi:hypothetical protein